MALVATINGVPVYSDKKYLSIIDSHVHFTDGSWCDVRSGDVSNNGPGYIRLGGSGDPSDGERITRGPKLFKAKSLDMRNVDADISVEIYPGPELEVTISGPAKAVDAISPSVVGDDLLIVGSHRVGGGDNVVISNISSGGISVIGSNIVIGGSGGSNPTKLTVKVPVGTPVTVDHAHGNTTIGDIEAPFTAIVQGSREVRAGRVTSAQLELQGSGDIRVSCVNGDVSAKLQGSGDIDIDGGFIGSLMATLQGSGDVTVLATARTASLSLQGSGDIKVEHVIAEPSKHRQGSGDIRVRRVG